MNLSSVDISFPVLKSKRMVVQRKRVTLTSDADAIAKKHNLSEAMVFDLARSYGGYQIADNIATLRALSKRGFYIEDGEGVFTPTSLYAAVCEQMFIVQVLP